MLLYNPLKRGRILGIVFFLPFSFRLSLPYLVSPSTWPLWHAALLQRHPWTIAGVQNQPSWNSPKYPLRHAVPKTVAVVVSTVTLLGGGSYPCFMQAGRRRSRDAPYRLAKWDRYIKHKLLWADNYFIRCCSSVLFISIWWSENQPVKACALYISYSVYGVHLYPAFCLTAGPFHQGYLGTSPKMISPFHFWEGMY